MNSRLVGGDNFGVGKKRNVEIRRRFQPVCVCKFNEIRADFAENFKRVKVIAGRDKDKEGKVIAVNKKDNTLLVEGVNMVTKHAKPSMSNQQGGILHQEGPIDASNVMFLHKGKATRVGFKMDGDKKVRFAKSTGDVID